MNHLKKFLKGIAQAFFLDHPAFGAGILLVLLVSNPGSFGAALLASVVGHIHSVMIRTPRTIEAFGIIPVNELFYGLAMASLFRPNGTFYLLLVLGALAIPILTRALHEVLQHWKVTPLVLPYILAVWTVWLIRDGAGLVSAPLAVQAQAPLAAGAWSSLAATVLEAIARVAFLQHAASGAAILALVAAFSPRRGAYFLAGTLVGVLATTAIAGAGPSAGAAASSFCPGLLGLGMASFPERFRWTTLGIYCALAAVITLAVASLLGGSGLPVLSLPFALTLWLAILSQTPRVSVSWARQRKPAEAESTAVGRRAA